MHMPEVHFQLETWEEIVGVAIATKCHHSLEIYPIHIYRMHQSMMERNLLSNWGDKCNDNKC